MTAFAHSLEALNWTEIANRLDRDGYALFPGLFLPAPPMLTNTDGLRRISLACNGLGQGDLYFYPQDLPQPLSRLRQAIYPHLAEVANRWNQALGVDERYPTTLQAFLQRQHQAGQTQPLSHLSKLSAAGYLALHQRTKGTHVFPLQLIGLLSAPDHDFTGGAFVMTEQRPRMQSRPMVLPLRQGDGALICTAHRPCMGRMGAYRVNLKHAISRLDSGIRIGLEFSFHNAP